VNMPSADAIFKDGAGRPTLRFERLLPHFPERVWRGLAESDEQAAWLLSPFAMEPTVGGAYMESDTWPQTPDGEVTEFDPPRLLGHTWGEDELRWELRPHDDGCVLILTHSFDDRLKAARDAAGWDVCLAALSTSLGGGANIASRVRSSTATSRCRRARASSTTSTRSASGSRPRRRPRRRRASEVGCRG
jgi:Uncharacterized conserved protein